MASKAYSRLLSRPCFYCGAKGSKENPITKDHYIPRALGGETNHENIRQCCFRCNQRKAAMHPFDWEIFLQNERRRNRA